jgi:hypothetical protein
MFLENEKSDTHSFHQMLMKRILGLQLKKTKEVEK